MLSGVGSALLRECHHEDAIADGLVGIMITDVVEAPVPFLKAVRMNGMFAP